MPRFVHIALFSSALLAAASAAPAHEDPVEKTELLKMAEHYGRIAGAAEFCAVDPAAAEEFIVKSLARLAKETEDRVLLAGARVEFNTHAAYGRAEGPKIGCERFRESFPAMMRLLE